VCIRTQRTEPKPSEHVQVNPHGLIHKPWKQCRGFLRVCRAEICKCCLLKGVQARVLK
jgi:hypothetical protein